MKALRLHFKTDYKKNDDQENIKETKNIKGTTNQLNIKNRLDKIQEDRRLAKDLEDYCF